MSWPRSLIAFYLLAFGVSWLGFVPAWMGWNSAWWSLALILPGGGPAVAAVLARRLAGESRPRGAAGRNANWRWYCLAVAIPALLITCANALAPGGHLDSPAVTGAALAKLVAMSIAANPWEEIGWRGFAQRRFEGRLPWHWSAVIVGVLWGLWHLPFFVWVDGPMMHFPFWRWLAALVAESVILAWVYNRAGRSIVVASVFHIAMNIFSGVLGVASFGTLAAVNGLFAAVTIAWRRSDSPAALLPSNSGL